MSDLKKILSKGAAGLDIFLEKSQSEQLLNFIRLLEKWNRKYNLSGVKNPVEMVKKHIIDSLSILGFIRHSSVLDVGSGAGFPGIVVALMRPEIETSVVDSSAKKCHFMTFVKAELGIENLTVICERVEILKIECCMHIIARAFAGVKKTLSLSRHLLCADGSFLLMKGEDFAAEDLSDLRFSAHPLAVPYAQKKRYIVEINL